MRRVLLRYSTSKRLAVTLPHKADCVHGLQLIEMVVILAASGPIVFQPPIEPIFDMVQYHDIIITPRMMKGSTVCFVRHRIENVSVLR